MFIHARNNSAAKIIALIIASIIGILEKKNNENSINIIPAIIGII